MKYFDYFKYESLSSNKEMNCFVAIRQHFLYIFDKNHMSYSPLLKLYLCGCSFKLYQSKKVNRLEICKVNGEVHTLYHTDIDSLNSFYEKVTQANLKLIPNITKYYGVLYGGRDIIHNVFSMEEKRLKVEDIYKDIKTDLQAHLSTNDPNVKTEIKCLIYFAQTDSLKDEIISASVPIIESLQEIYEDKSSELLCLSILQLCAILINSKHEDETIEKWFIKNINILYKLLEKDENIEIMRSVVSILYIYM